MSRKFSADASVDPKKILRARPWPCKESASKFANELGALQSKLSPFFNETPDEVARAENILITS